MKFNLVMERGEIRVTLTESLALPEASEPLLESLAAQESFDLLPQIESLVKRFLAGFEASRDVSR
jgi:hypothetical protein